ncbi:signal-induced proliferation-associated 1-like protein 3 [Mus caroli]|uniref:Signal-induced proliferation-associated 1-like protein 3 n=1 Tax=Mus caroli TaxID=10089 RepID=A0A6P7R1P8_MUSCR|nr:signal-induced proliferation-associated 1-like protein 3 [Mus caroli]
MTTYRPLPNDGVDLAASCGARSTDILPGPHPGDYTPMGFWAQNGSMSQPLGESPATATTRPSPTTPAMPKMGVRARVADWPPKRDALREQSNPSPSQDTDGVKTTKVAHSMRTLQNGQLPSSTPAPSGSRAFHRLSRRRSKDVEFQDGWPRSPGRAFLPLRHRSSSEITLSECDVEEPGDPRGTRHPGVLPLFREYGSTSSIDVQGVPEQSFFDILNEFRSEQPEARGSQNLRELLQVDPGALSGGSCGTKGDPRNGQPTKDSLQSLQPLKEKEKSRKKPVRGLGSGDTVDSSIFRKLRSSKPEGEVGRPLGETEESRSPPEASRPWVCQKSFAHFDVQSMLFDLNEAAANRVSVAQRRNTTTGASAASAASAMVTLTASRAHSLGTLDPAFTSTEDLNCKENLEQDLGDDNSNDLLLSCPHFRNEIGGERERNVSFSRASVGSLGGSSEAHMAEPTLSTHRTNASISVLEVPKEQQRTQSRPRQYSIEHVDLGARYYQDYFVGKEHANYFGVDEKLGPVAVSIKREKLEDHKDHGPQYQYRIIFRTRELITLRGSILEDATPTATKHGTGRGLPLKDALEYVIPELNIHCLRLALNTPKVTEQLLKLDEQGLCRKHKVGILYCKAGQSSEEEMYNNEEAGPAFEEFLDLLGDKVCLKGFTKYAAQLDVKTDSTGTHSLYTTYQDYEIMFHVSTLLPYTPNNRQQLLRKRHIGNDIVTIIFQEPGALPFTPKNIRSHFQHVFIIVRVHNPCTENVCYRYGCQHPGHHSQVMTNGWETVDMTLRRNGLGQLGFHVKYDGTVAEVEDYGFAWQAGLRQGSRLVEICKVAVVTLSHDQMIDLLRTSVTVKVVIIPPFEDGTPRRGWPETYDMNTSEPKTESETTTPGSRPPYRNNAPWQWSGPASHNSLPATKWTTPATPGHAQSLSRLPKQTPVVPFRESQPLHSKRPVSFPETPFAASPAGADRVPPYRQPSGSFSTPGSATYARYKPSPERYAAAPHPLLSFDPHFMHDGMSSGDSSSGGLTSQESTMERPKPEPLWHVPAQARLSAMTGSIGSKHPSRQDAAGKDSPNRHSKGEPQYSSHSSSNTLSSNASSSHSDDRWFDPLDPLEPEQDPFSKGGSSDSGIDTTLYTSSPSCMSLAKAPRPTKPHKPPGNIGLCGGGRESAGRPHPVDRRREVSPAPVVAGQNKGYRPKLYSSGSCTPPGLVGGSRDPPRQPSDMGSRAGYPTQVYKTASAETPRPSQLSQCSPFQLSTSVPKSFFSKQPAHNKHSTGWKRTDEPPPRPLPFTDSKKQVDTNAKNVFGQPRLRASLRDLRSPRKNYKSTIEDDLKKLIVMDNLGPEQERDPGQSPQKSLQRTLSDESLCSGRREPSFASPASLEPGLPSDVLFTSTCTFPSSTLPARRQHQHQHAHPPSGAPSTTPATGNGFPEKKSAISASELSLADGRDRPLRRLDPGMMPLPDTAAGLEWSSLVNAAKAYEVQRAVSLFSLNDPALSPEIPPAHSPVHSHLSLERGPQTPRATPTMSEESPLDLTGKVYQLEVMLKQLHTDLQKEKQDKVVLQSEVASLRQNNQRLQEESQAASEQLRKFAELFSREKKEL